VLQQGGLPEKVESANRRSVADDDAHRLT
jgi:hypothetical protein